MYNDRGIDPEGVLSTIPSIAQVLIGFWFGKICMETPDSAHSSLVLLLLLLLSNLRIGQQLPRLFKQKTAYEMESRDWSSDVCSSDLAESYRSVAGTPLCSPRR